MRFLINHLSKLLLALTLILSSTVIAQDKVKVNVTGTIINSADNSALPGVNVIIRGTTTGTITDLSGDYNIECLKGDTLLFSFIGFISELIPVSGQTRVDIQMIPDIASLSEVVVIGYGTLKKSHISGSISKIKNVDLDKIPIARSDLALQGKMAGVKIQNTDSEAGTSPTITIRGTSSITTSNSPLIVVDGYPIPDDLSSVDMANVESIEVLKDAASAAIYGSRASNGVILVTTKKGEAGKTIFNFNAYTGFKQAYPYEHIYPTVQEWANFATTDAQERGIEVPEQIAAMASLGTYTDWEGVALRDQAAIQNYSFSASGGNEKTRFYLGAGYTNDEGIVETNNYEKFNFNVNLDSKLRKWLEVGTIINSSYSTQRVSALDFHDIIRTQAWCPVYHTEETALIAQASGYDVSAGDLAHERHFKIVGTDSVNLQVSSGQNGWAYLTGQNKHYKNFSASANTYATIHLASNLSFKTTFGAYFRNKNNYYYMSSFAKNNGDTRGTFGNYQYLNWLNENILSYTKSVGKHEISAIAGFSEQSNSTSTAFMDVSDFLTDEIETLNAGTVINSSYTQESKNTLVSAFFRINYAFSGKYIFALSNRWDGSSRFGSNNRWAYFPALSAAWHIGKESFLDRANWISELKLRASYGSTGNNNIGDYTALAVVEPGTNAAFGSVQQGFTQSSIANASLSWEKTNETNLGVDFGVFSNRIRLGLDYYTIITDQLLLNREIPSVTGFTNSWTNMGSVKNQGIEFEITTHNIVSDNFSWSTTANCYTNKNTLIDLGGPKEQITTPDSKRPSQFLARLNEPLAQFYGYEIDHSMGENGEVPRDMLQTPYYPIAVGSSYAYVKDQDGNGVINEDDRVVLGDPYSDFDWSITNNFTYKNFDLSFMIEGSHGAQIYNVDSYYYETQWKGNYLDGVDNEDYLQSKIVTDYNVQNASYVTLRNLLLGYSIPSSVTNKIKVSSLRVYFAASNLLYFMADDYTGLNPEGINRYDETLTWGYQRGALPVQQSFTLGLNLQF